MTKKFISLVLSLALVIGLIPMMSVSADASAVTVLYEEDFTNFNLTSFNTNYDSSSNQYTVTDKDGTVRFKTGKLLRTDIINMPGYDGENTNVIKVILDPPSKTSISSTEGFARMNFSNLKAALGNVTGGAVVYEFKMYIPEADSSGNRKDIAQFYMSPIVKTGTRYAVGTAANDEGKRTLLGDATPGNWYKFTYVVLVNEEKRAVVYCNDELVSYKQEAVKLGNEIQMQKMRNADDEHIIFDDFKIWHIAAVSDTNLAPQCITSAASDFADLENVSDKALPTVDFTNPLLVRTVGSDATVSTANVVMTKSDETPVELAAVNAINNNESIQITPAFDLAKGETYNVRVTGLKDMYDQTIPDYVFSFTTVEPNEIIVSDAPVFTKEDLFVTGGNSTEITTLQNGFINASFTFENGAAQDQPVIILAVLKDGSTIKAFQFEQGTIGTGETLTFNGGFNVDNIDTQSIEVYVWDSLYGMSPLVGKCVINKNGVTQN